MEKISRVNSDHSRYKARERFSVFPARDWIENSSLLMASFSETENISRVDSDHFRYTAQERSSAFLAQDLNREFQLV